MNGWEQSKQDFIDKLGRADKIFKDIFTVDSDGLVIQGEERDELRNLQAANKKILDKLKSREFTVAIVGLENSGKSTLGNALIKDIVLPEYEARCTYTTTEMRAGSVDIAEVYFYSHEEFNKKFQEMLALVKYPDESDFETLSLESFKRYWQETEQNPEMADTRSAHDGRTTTDIERILEGKQKIKRLLGQSVKKFGPEFWRSDDKFNEFKTYVTGMVQKSSEGVIKRDPSPYAVKKVIIRSTHLADMSHIVLYDVPGFNSPTELHRRQTLEMLKESDAIIFVTNVGRYPNLDATQLGMLSQGIRDSDGIELKDKCFAFGNMIDLADSLENAKSNFAIQKDELVNTYRIARAEHIFCGSAKAHLEKIGLYHEKIVSPKLDKWQLSYGVETLIQELQKYYDNARFTVLKRRAENILSKTQPFFKKLLDRYDDADNGYINLSSEILMKIQSRLPIFTKEAKGITDRHIKLIVNERPFTTALKSKVDKIFPLIEESYTKLVEDKERESFINTDDVYPTIEVDANLRKELSKIFIETIVKSAAQLTTERQRKLRLELVDSFLTNMNSEGGLLYREELEKSVNELFDKMLIEGGEKCSFTSLVERFVTTPIQAIIGGPFTSPDRCNKITKALEEFVSLSFYYEIPDDDASKKSLKFENLIEGGEKFFTKILAHEDVETPVYSAPDSTTAHSENENKLRELFIKNRKRIFGNDSFNVDNLPLKNWADIMTRAGITVTDILPQIGHLLDDYDEWSKKSVNQKKLSIHNVILDCSKENSTKKSDADKTQMPNVNSKRTKDADKKLTADTILGSLEEIQELAEDLKRISGKDDMIATLDTDIMILRDITAKAVINAIGLERAFNSVIAKNVDLIREHLSDPDGNGNEIFREWIRKNAPKLKPNEFERINEDETFKENRKKIVNAIKDVFAEWN